MCFFQKNKRFYLSLCRTWRIFATIIYILIMVEKIDALDQQILEIISKNARVPFKDVATVCGLSRAAIHQRVAHLIETGVIVGSSYTINPKSLGYTTCTYVGIKLERASMYESVATQLAKIPEIVECHFTTGPYTMLIKLYSRDNEHLMELLNKGIQQIDGVNSTETLISLEQSFSRTAPICLPAASAKAKRASRKNRTALSELGTDIQD